MVESKQLHICHLVYRFDVGGLERVLLNCVQKLPESDYRHSIIALTDIGEFAQQLPANVDTFALHKAAGKDLSSHKKLYQLLRQCKPDVLHSYNLATMEYHPAAMMAGVKKRIHVEHGRDIYDPQGTNKKYQWLRRLITPFVHRVVAVSDELNQWLLHVVKLPASKVRLVYNGIDTDHFAPQAENHLPLVIGSVARLSPIKDQASMLNAFALLLEQWPSEQLKPQLNIAGDGELMPALRQQAAQLNITDDVVFLGHQTDMRPHYHSFDIFTLSSLAEGIPMTVLEAMASGLPIVATHVGGLPELVSNNGTLVPVQDPQALANAWLNLLENHQDRLAAGQHSRERVVRDFSEIAMIGAYQKIYHGEQ
ncbi:TIGR03088 family PEP-CTERM/XrtA system glycosyltransferase [Echinimonas agarilytica]|uniref:TIGR03088 family PEP-CTERM/XrtA system glycosyltransferase n=1 Tax=Echinimonas agarilytica TaxID=1215918 RepID=A0AA42B8Z8_9GAMM|nr:TIGR03088 family PEP-CTERM/XrtA system glycosyltransferase [Echinimonas agarilytica]